MQANKQLVNDIDVAIIPTSGMFNSFKTNKNENIKINTQLENKIEYQFRLKKGCDLGVYHFNKECYEAVSSFLILFRFFMSTSELESLEDRVRGRDWAYCIKPMIKSQNTFDPTTVLDARSLITKATDTLVELETLKSQMLDISKFGTRDSKDINEDKRIATLLVEGFDIVIAELQYSIVSMGEQATLGGEQPSVQDRHILQKRLELSQDVFEAISKYAEQALSA